MAKQVILGSKRFEGTNEFFLKDDNVIVEPYKWVKPISAEGCTWGFIAPDGRIFGGTTYIDMGTLPHLNLADRLEEREDVMRDLHDHGIFDFIDSALEKRGWIKFNPTNAYAHCKPSNITAEQQEALVSIMRENNRCMSVGDRSRTYNYAQVRIMDLLQFANTITEYR